MSDPQEICSICSKPKKSSSSASITQWISTCACDLEADIEKTEAEYEICQTCGKRIGESRKGSFTQYIFQPEFCNCSKPKVAFDRKNDFYSAPEAEEEEDFSDAEPLEVDPETFPAERFKPYKILGKGAAGTVYLCRDTTLSKNVAVKVLNTIQPEQLVKFQEEAVATSTLNHPLIIKIFDFGITKGQAPYMVLEYFKGEPLSDYLKSYGQLNWLHALSIGIEICTALSYSHSLEIFHRDIKPENVLIYVADENEFPILKVIDFGIARIGVSSSSKDVIGTPAYMSPDQLKGLEYGASSEVYSLGCLIFELLTGVTPYKIISTSEILSVYETEETPRVSDYVEVPEALDDAIYKAISKDVDDRYSSIAEFKSVLQSCYEKGREFERHPVSNALDVEAESDINFAQESNLSLWKILIPVVAIISIAGTAAYVYIDNQNKAVKIAETKRKRKRKKPVRRLEDLFSITRRPKMRIDVKAIGDIKDKDLALLVNKFDSKMPLLIDLHAAKIDGSGLKYLIGLPVTKLNINDTSLKPEAAETIANMQSLRDLLIEATGISDQFIEELGILQNLNRINLSNNSELTDKALASLSKMKGLSHITLDNVQFTDAGLRSLSKLNIDTLYCRNNKNISYRGLLSLRRSRTLRYLNVSFCKNIDRRALKALSKLNCEYLYVGGDVQFKPRDLLLLNKARKLIRLGLTDVRPIRPYFKYLSRLKHLRTINLNDTDLNDQDLNALIKMKHIKRFRLTASLALTPEAVQAAQLKTKTVLSTDQKDIKGRIGNPESLFVDGRW